MGETPLGVGPRRRTRLGLAGALAAAGLGWACSDAAESESRSSAPKPTPAAPTATATPAAPTGAAEAETAAAGGADLVARGRQVYMSNCIACHNMDPTLEGGLGPAVEGASYELLEARVVRGGYPLGYTPKRSSNTMPRFEHLADQVDALAAYLAEAGS